MTQKLAPLWIKRTGFKSFVEIAELFSRINGKSHYFVLISGKIHVDSLFVKLHAFDLPFEVQIEMLITDNLIFLV